MPDVSFADLRCRFQTGRSYVVSGTGRNRIYGYRTGVMCQLGDIERSDWIQMVKDLICRSGDSRVIDCSKLMTMEDFVEKLFEEGGTFTALTNLCEDNEVDFGTPLYWMHPYTDGLYNGCYFVMVREGVLALSYDAIDWENHEVFDRESVRLCDADEMRSFYWEYKKRTGEMLDTMNAFLFFLERREEFKNR